MSSPTTTLNWCIETLQKNNFPYPLDNGGKDPNGTPIYKNAYLYLRSQIRTHISLGTQPELIVYLLQKSLPITTECSKSLSQIMKSAMVSL